MSEENPISVVILTLDEEALLPSCLESLEGLEANVFVVDSGSSDRTVEIARDAGCQIFEHEFDNYAAQRNWAIGHLPIDSKWMLHMDAGERLTPELASEISTLVRDPSAGHAGYMVKKRTIFMGRWLRHGGQYPSYHLRLLAKGRGHCENRLYDQHFIADGTVGYFEHDLIDVLNSDLTTWVHRHNRWARLEAEEIVTRGGPDSDADARPGVVEPRFFGDPIQRKRFLRSSIYNHLPLFVRPVLYWVYSYVFRLGFMDGLPGLVFHTLQRFWFRFLVDAKLYEITKVEDHERGD